MLRLSLVIGIIAIAQLSTPPTATSQEKTARQELQFNRDIRPILSDRCFLCHGPDQSSDAAKETDLRLDQRESATDHGVFDFTDLESSEILLRVLSDDSDDQMPPPGSGKKRLTQSEIGLIRQWIQEGANYEKHWSFVAPKRPEIPMVEIAGAKPTAIDAFVLKRLESEHVLPAKPAGRHTLIRRATFDLTGLPPTIAEIDDFITDTSSDDLAFAKVIDRLLASPHFGEQMARSWLDAARYADTSGYQYDRERHQWVWRDWVINAFNTNKPFDEFTIEQLAGDLLPDATDQTRLATGFNRNHPITIEGGVVDEEYRTEYVIDRVVTTSTVFMGQTFLCARCHDHKYDPISQQDFYQFYAFFNNVPEKGLNGFDPKQKIVSPLNLKPIERLQQDLKHLETEIADLNLPMKQWANQLRDEHPSWQCLIPESVKSSGDSTHRLLDDDSVLFEGPNPDTDDYEVIVAAGNEPVASIQLEALLHESLTNQSASRGSNGNFVLSEFTVERNGPETKNEFQPVEIESATADYEQRGFEITKAIDGKVNNSGWAVDGNTKPENRIAIFNLKHPIQPGDQIRIKMMHRYGRSHQIGRFRLSVSTSRPLDSQLEAILSKNLDQNTDAKHSSPEFTRLLIGKYGTPAAKQLGRKLDQAQEKLAQLSAYPETMVMKEMPTPRPVYVLERGEYDKPRKDNPLQPGIPSAMGSMGKFPKNRLGLAQWLVSEEQPLTARVTVNRFWQRLFGVGLVKTSEDFGAQGEYPTHPELLDWLAVEFVESGWNVKQIFKTMMMSHTYRQSSSLSQASLARDPENRLLGRGPRLRLDGEVIRDNALAVSGLLNREVGGASVYPYHPDGLWLEINNRPNYSRAYPHKQDAADLYRRSLYTFWKRTVPPPSVATFDAPSREYCVVRRSRTNTPLQAFVMLHDPQFVEAARKLAERMINEGGQTSTSQIQFGFKLCTSRNPTEAELEILKNTFDVQREQYRNAPAGIDQLLSVGNSPVDKSLDRQQLAALTQVARMMINLSEFLTKS